jgi:hypothetical protein
MRRPEPITDVFPTEDVQSAVKRSVRQFDPRAHIELPPMPAQFQHIAEARAWAGFLESNLDRFQRTIDVPIGKLLGCGRFGCVFESDPPWVVKLTRDVSEGPVWSYMASLLEPDEDFPELAVQLPSFLVVRDVVRITPDVVFNGNVEPVFGIVREEAVPVFVPFEVRNPFDDSVVAQHMALSSLTAEILGLSEKALKRVGLPEPVLYIQLSEQISRFHPGVQKQFALLHDALLGSRSYRVAADRFHQLRWIPIRLRDEAASLREITLATEQAEEALLDVVQAWQRLQKNSLATELGLTLETSLNAADLVFRDLHAYNIGWRTHRVIAGIERPQCMVILDPGAMATPHSPTIREVELQANGLSSGYDDQDADLAEADENLRREGLIR